MHSFCRKSNLLWVVLMAFGLVTALPTASQAKPRPGKPASGFRLFAKATGALTVNRIYCGLATTGEICVDSLNSSTVGGGFWPKGTADQYVFNSGLQLAGLIGSDANPEWAGDTTSGQLFSPRGDNVGEEVEKIYNASDPDDLANWPQAAFVPQGDASENLFDPLLRGRKSASQGDVWFLSWEGNPSFAAGREHPLGVMVEQRGMGWNYPSGNEDILYFIYTFYNVTARDPNAYLSIRPGMREIAQAQGVKFQDQNENRFSIDIPDGGYTLENLFAAFGADMDVAEAGANYASVNVPFSLGYTYESTFTGTEEWTFDPGIFGAPFFPGSGFVGVKYLKSPEINGAEVGLTLFSNTINGGAFDDASNSIQLFRYLSNNISTAAGDAACNTGNPQVTKICYVNTGQPDDMRFFQSSGPLTLGPGQFASIAVAYIFAAPVAVGACTGPGVCELTPGDPTRLANVAQLNVGANPVDSVAGFDGFDDANGDNIVQQSEIATVPGSLLGKSLTAQQIFNLKFLLPFAPETPGFFLIPGNNQVTVLWQPSASEATGDPFFAVANSPTVPDPITGAPAVNQLYDPNYRQFDVEGYRVYRGRVDSPNSLTLIAQFDYSGTFIRDFGSQVNPVPGCAPELGVNVPTIDPTTGDTTGFGCPVTFDSVGPGEVPTVSIDVPLAGPIVQIVKGKGRGKLADGNAILFQSDTAVTGAASGCLVRGTPALCALKDNGVPFVFVDNTAKNNLRYFYSVTAFDINSFQSGPSSIESARVTKSTTPSAPASNLTSTATLTQSVSGRGVTVSDNSAVPTIDPTTGRFSGKFPPANAATIGFVGQFAQSIFSGTGNFSATLIGLSLGDARNGVPVTYTYETNGAGVLDTVSLGIAQPLDASEPAGASGPFPAALSDPTLAATYGVPAGYVQNGVINQVLTGYQFHTGFGRGCAIDGLMGDNCFYNGPRWFAGDNETKADPNAGNVAGTEDAADNNNAGELPGILTIQNPQSYHQVSGAWRTVESALGGAVRAADYKVYWGEAGVIDSVIDVTHNVVVPFMPDSLGAGWGILNPGVVAPTLTASDFTAVFPLSSADRQPDQAYGNTDVNATLSNTAVPGPIGISSDETGTTPRPNPGFAIYLSGQIFLLELAPGSSVPADGTVWTMRSYIGFVNGGNGAAGALGPYSFTPVVRNFSALGAALNLTYTATNAVAGATATDLRRVHTVPDPYYVTNGFEQSPDNKIIKFVNLPQQAIIRIYSSSGVLVALLEHSSSTFGGDETWNVRNRNNQVVASGVYFYHVESGDARRVGRFTVVNFAQ